MKSLIIITGLLNSLSLFSVDTSRCFFRINEEKSTSEVAFKNYLSPDGRTTVQLIGISHKAVPSFYESVAKLLTGKVVIYEMLGGNLEDSEKLDKRIVDIGPRYQSIYQAVERFVKRPDSLGRIPQHNLIYANAKELIHADVGAEDELSKTMKYNMNVMNDSQLKSRLNEFVFDFLRNRSIEIEEGQDDVAQFEFCLDKMPVWDNSIRLSYLERENVKQTFINDKLLRQGQCVENLKARFGDQWQELCLGRNEFIFTALKNLWSRSEVPPEIAIAYGACHLGFVEDFLLQNGYRPLSEKDGWLVTATLVPPSVFKPGLAMTARDMKNPVHVSIKDEVKKTLFSADGTIKIYLIGAYEPNHIGSDHSFDNFFLHGASSGFGESKSRNEGKILGVVYTPNNMDLIERELLLNGFKSVKTEPFDRSNKKDMISFRVDADFMDAVLDEILGK